MRRAAIERLLPAAYQRDASGTGVLTALLAVMESLHAPSEGTLAAVDDLFGPYRAPDRLMPFLAGWVALDHVVAAGASRAVQSGAGRPDPGPRRPRRRTGPVARHRGRTPALLQTATGCAGFVIDEPPERPFHIVVRVPAAAADHLHAHPPRRGQREARRVHVRRRHP